MENGPTTDGMAQADPYEEGGPHLPPETMIKNVL